MGVHNGGEKEISVKALFYIRGVAYIEIFFYLTLRWASIQEQKISKKKKMDEHIHASHETARLA